MCRRLHGAIFASFAIVGREHFAIERGAVLLCRYDSSPGTCRCFCSRCGSQIYSDVDKLPDIRFFTVGTLDGGAHPGHRPEDERHIFVDSKVPWRPIADHLPQSPEY